MPTDPNMFSQILNMGSITLTSASLNVQLFVLELTPKGVAVRRRTLTLHCFHIPHELT